MDFEKSNVEQDETMEKVKNLLLGSEIKKLDINFTNIKTEFDYKLANLKKHVDVQFKTLVSLVEKQNQTLTTLIQKIEGSSDEKFVLLGQKISEANERNLKTFESVSKTQSRALDELKNSLGSEIEKLYTDTQRDISILREIKLNRNMLSKVFKEASEKLTIKN